MNVAKLRILIGLCLLVGAGLIAYPIAVWLHSELIALARAPATNAPLASPTSSFLASAGPAASHLGFHLSFSIAFFAACVVLKGQLRNLVAGWIGTALRGAALVAVAACVLWIGLLFALSLLASLDRFFVATVFVVTSGLLICVRLLLGLVRPSGWGMIGGAAAVFVVSYGAAANDAALPGLMAAAMALSMLASFSVLGGALARRGSAPTTELIVSVIAGHALFVAACFFLGGLGALPRGLLLASVVIAALVGLIPIIVQAAFNRREGNPVLYHPGQASLAGAWAALVRETETPATTGTVWIVQRGESNLARLHFLASTLADSGRSVVVCVPTALANQIKPGPWAVVTMPEFVPLRLRIMALLALLRLVAGFASFAGDRSRQLVHANRAQVFHDKASLRRFAAEHTQLRPAIVICTDWEAGPAAAALADSVGAKLVYDASEYESDQYFNDARWVSSEAPVAVAVAVATQRAASLTTIAAESLRTKIRDRSSNGAEPLLVRSAPAMATAPVFRPVEERVHLLYSGDIVGSRGIEALVDAMPAIKTRYRLTLSGQADHGFLGGLKRQIAKLGLDADVAIDLLDEPRHERSRLLADAGIVLWPDHTPKVVYSVPEQFFEHVQAGRGVFLVGSGEAADLVRATGTGAVIGGHTAADISATLNSVGAQDVEAYKRAAVAAAAEMNGAYFGHKLAVAL